MMAGDFFRIAAVAAALAALGACATSRNLDASFADFGANAELKGVLFSDRNHDYSDIDLTVYEGRLLLTGTMLTEEGRRKLVANAWKADGVKQVIDEVLIRDHTSLGQGFEDTRIDQTLRAKFIADGDVVSGDIKITVSGATVYLLGATRSQGQIERALHLASTTGGVEKVVTYIELRDGAVMR